MNNKRIGIFDSGLGGLTVVKEIMKIMPDEGIVYLGDTARYPYGTKTKETIIRFSAENTEFLIKKKVKLIIAACNTASAAALPYLKRNFNIEMMGVIDSGARAAAEATVTKRVGVIGTRATIASGAYEKAIAKADSRIKIFTKATPLLAPLVEEEWINKKETKMIVKDYLACFKKVKIDTLVLGCTHYPLLKGVIAGIMPGVRIIDSAGAAAEEALRILGSKRLNASKNNRAGTAFYVTDTPETFNKIGKMFLKKNMVYARKTTVGR
ncbi:MAG: glutamate racemase [Candidatus Goldiibacteriota bacterium]